MQFKKLFCWQDGQNLPKELEGATSLVLPNGRQPKPLLEAMIISLPVSVRKNIRNGDDGYLAFIRTNTPAPDTKNPNSYLGARLGIIPQKTIEASIENGSTREFGWYNAPFSDSDSQRFGLGQKLGMRIILEEGNLPPRDDIELLLKHETHGSRTLDIDRKNYLVEEVRYVLNVIYSGLNSKELIAKLKDISDSELEEASVRPIITLHQQLRMAEHQKNRA